MNHLTYVWGIPASEDFYYKVGTRLELHLKSFLSLSWLSPPAMGVGFLEKKLDSLNFSFLTAKPLISAALLKCSVNEELRKTAFPETAKRTLPSQVLILNVMPRSLELTCFPEFGKNSDSYHPRNMCKVTLNDFSAQSSFFWDSWFLGTGPRVSRKPSSCL